MTLVYNEDTGEKYYVVDMRNHNENNYSACSYDIEYWLLPIEKLPADGEYDFDYLLSLSTHKCISGMINPIKILPEDQYGGDCIPVESSQVTKTVIRRKVAKQITVYE